MCKVNVYEAKTNLSRYIELLESGKEKEVIITRYGKEVAVLSLINTITPKKRVGAALGILEKKDFDLKSEFNDLNKEMGY